MTVISVEEVFTKGSTIVTGTFLCCLSLTTFCFVGDSGWVRHLGVAEDNQSVAFRVFFVCIEVNIFFTFDLIFAIECQIPVI